MAALLCKRALWLLPALLGLSALSFALIHLIPGDPVQAMAGARGLDAAEHARLLHQLGLDLPLPLQYLRYLHGALQGSFGVSFFTHNRVLDEFLQRLPATLELSAAAMLLAVLLGLPAGIVAALQRGRWPDQLLMGACIAGYSLPVFWWGLLLMLGLSVHLGWTPVSGRLSPLLWVEPGSGFLLWDAWRSGDAQALRDALWHLVLPAVVLATVPLAVIARMSRSAMLEVLGADYVRAARAKGVSPRRVVWVHALRNAMLPVVTVTGLQVGTLLGGAILTETLFSWPGIGQWMVQAIHLRDYPVLQGSVLLVGLLVLLVHMLVDLSYALLCPRILHAA